MQSYLQCTNNNSVFGKTRSHSLRPFIHLLSSEPNDQCLDGQSAIHSTTPRLFPHWLYIVVKEEVKSTWTESENKISGGWFAMLKKWTINIILPNPRQYYYIERWNWDQVEGNEYTPLCCAVQWMALTLKSQFFESSARLVAHLAVWLVTT